MYEYALIFNIMGKTVQIGFKKLKKQFFLAKTIFFFWPFITRDLKNLSMVRRLVLTIYGMIFDKMNWRTSFLLYKYIMGKINEKKIAKDNFLSM